MSWLQQRSFFFLISLRLDDFCISIWRNGVRRYTAVGG